MWRLLTPQLSPEDLHMLWCRRSPRRTGHSAQRPSGVYVDLDTSIDVQKRTAERVSEESADAQWRRERAALDLAQQAALLLAVQRVGFLLTSPSASSQAKKALRAHMRRCR
ncbi:MAG TPA: hypothetical protein VJY65_01570 [Chloroflexota bacterium]|nr:hypothetical protein [Chloroflexota bacterium]